MSQDFASDFTSGEPVESTFTVFEDGDYPFDILEMNAITRSANGNDMLPIKLEFTSPDGDKATVYEYLVFTEKAAFKINQFLASVKIPTGTRINFRDAEFIKYIKAKSGIATLSSEPVKGKDYMRNKVVKFIYGGSSKRDKIPSHKAEPSVPVDDTDDIPSEL
jgi:hypothetical protein